MKNIKTHPRGFHHRSITKRKEEKGRKDENFIYSAYVIYFCMV